MAARAPGFFLGEGNLGGPPILLNWFFVFFRGNLDLCLSNCNVLGLIRALCPFLRSKCKLFAVFMVYCLLLFFVIILFPSSSVVRFWSSDRFFCVIFS